MPEFVATDGTVFTSRKEWRKYEFVTNYTFKEKEGEECTKREINGQPFDISNLTNCRVMLCDHSDQVQIDECQGCKIFVGACSESVFVRNCTDCTFYVACKQLRLRECTNSTFSLYSQTEPVIEMSSGIAFTPFAGGYPGQREHMSAANLDPAVNFWWGVFDFNDEQKTGHNFSINASPDQPWWPLDDNGDQIIAQTTPGSAPLPSTLDGHGAHGGATLPPQAQKSFQSFGITTSQKDAQRAVEENTQPVEDLQPPPPPPTTNNDKTIDDPPPLPARPAAKKDESSWEAVRLGIRYQPMVLAIQYKEPGDDTFAQKDLHIDSVNDDDTPDSILTRLLTGTENYASYLDFERKISKRQVLRLLGMLIDYSRRASAV